MASHGDEFPFDIGGLAVFLAVCDASSMTGAARRLGVTQPAVSIAIADLEARLETRLVDRTVRPLTLTPAGALLRQRASALLSEARQIKPMIREVGRGRLPLLRIGVVDSLARALSPPLVRAAAEMADEVAVLCGLTASHTSALLTRNLDIMIGLDDLADAPDLERWPLLVEAYVLALPAGSPEIVTVEDLAALSRSHEFVRFSSRSSTGIDIERHLRRLGLDLPRRLEFDAPHGVVGAVCEGRRFAITTPICLLDSGAGPDRFVCRSLPGPSLTRRVTLVAHRDQHGKAPLALADAARAALSADVMPPLRRLWPMLSELVEITGSSATSALRVAT